MDINKLQKFILENGLRVIFYPHYNTDIVNINILYNVGARDENEEITGFAHLFEHLMFGGSKNIPDFDKELQKAGGNNNAFTTNDITNYYITIPAVNIETAFWLESDRMLELAFSQKSLDTQKNVVVEEFKQRYLNQPYGDLWLYLRKLAYKTHPYKWPTIGKKISHIQNAKMEDVKSFFYKYYAPNNAILVIAGNAHPEKTIKLVDKWFGNIEKRNVPQRNLPKERKQIKHRQLNLKRKVPSNLIIKAFHTCGRLDKDYYATDMISDILSSGKSSRLYQKLVREKRMFSGIEAYISGSIDPGLLIVEGFLNDGISFQEAEIAIEEELNKLKTELINDYELKKIKNKIESNYIYSNVSLHNLAMNLAYNELLSNAEDYFYLPEKYNNVDSHEIKRVACEILNKSNCSTIYYEKITN
ncbi:MAG: pitrilysin family protein [Marinilabiliales bacterium]